MGLKDLIRIDKRTKGALRIGNYFRFRLNGPSLIILLSKKRFTATEMYMSGWREITPVLYKKLIKIG